MEREWAVKMQGENALISLQKYNPTKTQTQIFIHLIKAGACSVGGLSKSLKTKSNIGYNTIAACNLME
ncbi:MAG: hypothetical protein QXK78_03020 [Candidatus Bathyarchaeia archaeon]